jgi:quercetin dioxygenase-like cupin family protein
MRRFVQFTLTLLLMSAFVGAVDAGARAAQPESQPVTLECATEMSIQMLGSAQPASAEGQSLVLVRAFFGVGGGIGPHTHPGTLIVAVESGQFGVTLEDDHAMGMAVMRAGEAGTPAVEEMLTPGQETVLNPGDYFIETGMVHSARTVGEEPVAVTFTGLVEAGQPVTSCV